MRPKPVGLRQHPFIRRRQRRSRDSMIAVANVFNIILSWHRTYISQGIKIASNSERDRAAF